MSDISAERRYQLAEQFCDVPTNNENGAFICYADVLQWVSEYLSAAGGWPAETTEEWHARETEARRRISLLCQTEKLQAFGLTPTGRVEELPSKDWANLHINELDGQPDDDLQRHGGRPYGEAWWKDTKDASKLKGLGWTALSFRKLDVLAAWPSFTSDAVSTETILKRGRKPGYDWDDAKDHAFRLFSEKGDFRDWDVEWKAQAELELEVLSYIERSVGEGEGPVESTIRRHVSAWLCEWRANAAHGKV